MAAAKNQATSVDTLKTYESQISTVFGFIIVVAIGIGLLFLLRRTTSKSNPQISDSGKQTTAENLMKDETSAAGKYMVKKGDHLWKIAESEMKDGYQWVTIANANGIKAPYVVKEGQSLTIPSPDPKLENLMVKATSAPAVAKPVATVAPTPKSNAPVAQAPTTSVTPSGSVHTVVAGENLWKIAVAEYKDGYKWVEIYKANKKLIGSNPGIIRVGQQLTLPSGK